MPAIELHLDNEGNGHVIVGGLKIDTHQSWDIDEDADVLIEEKFDHDTVSSVWLEFSKAKAAEYRRRFKILEEEGVFQSRAVTRVMGLQSHPHDTRELEFEVRMRAGASFTPFGKIADRLSWLNEVEPDWDVDQGSDFVCEAESLLKQSMQGRVE